MRGLGTTFVLIQYLWSSFFLRPCAWKTVFLPELVICRTPGICLCFQLASTTTKELQEELQALRSQTIQSEQQYGAARSKYQQENLQLSEQVEDLKLQLSSQAETARKQAEKWQRDANTHSQEMEFLQSTADQQSALNKKLQQQNDELAKEIDELQQVTTGPFWGICATLGLGGR